MCCSYVYKKGEYLFYLFVFYLFIPRAAMDSLVLKVFDSLERLWVQNQLFGVHLWLYDRKISTSSYM